MKSQLRPPSILSWKRAKRERERETAEQIVCCFGVTPNRSTINETITAIINLPWGVTHTHTHTKLDVNTNIRARISNRPRIFAR